MNGLAPLPTPPVLVAGRTRALILDETGTAREMPHEDAVAATTDGLLPVLCHLPSLARRLGTGRFPALDILELFAFVRPARFCLPTPAGIAKALELDSPVGLAEEAGLLRRAALALLAELGRRQTDEPDPTAAPVVRTMARGRWPWAPFVLVALGETDFTLGAETGIEVWRRLREWSEQAPEPPPGTVPVTSAEARARLAELVGPGAEDRPQQGDYASALAAAFAPRDREDAPNMVISEAGTGIGKTLGYLAPASLWSEKNGAPVWISTYTRNLQRQIDGELDRLCPDPRVKARRVVIRKGRENYLCLLNMEEAAGRIGARPDDAVALGLVARWAGRTRDGDMMGGDFPAWLPDMVGRRATLGLTDRRGECIYSACAHYHKCFIERTIRRARRADIVIANHALVMAHAATGGLDDGNVPTEMVFDEGHHVFDAADSAFSAHLSGQEGADLRNWLIGAEEGRRSRARGLARRIEDIAAIDDGVGESLEQLLEAARALPSAGWIGRMSTSRPRGVAEAFLSLVRQQVYARAQNPASPYDLETDTCTPVAGLVAAAEALGAALADLANPMRALAERLAGVLDTRASDLDGPTRSRIEAVCRGLRRRVEGQVEAWRDMLASIADGPPEIYVDWFAVTRLGGRDTDIGMHRHWIDPAIPFARFVAAPAQGLVVTSATLRDGTGDDEADWRAAEARTGARHLAAPAVRAHAPSPFDYAACTRVIVVNDVRKDDLNQVAGAYRELFVAAGGGALGLFTAIARLRAVHEHIAPALEKAGLTLLSQHVDRLDTASLIDIFREQPDSCLLGTDAVRDGVDVPGRSLRLIVFDRVPWARPSILHRARRREFGGRVYDDMIARLRLKQAYGRLIRRAGDHGVFLVLDPMLPSRLTGAFPEGVAVERIGLADAVRETREFLAASAPAS